MSEPQKPGKPAGIDVAAQTRIGRKLRVFYAGFTREPLPMEQVDLLLAFRRAERERTRAQG